MELVTKVVKLLIAVFYFRKKNGGTWNTWKKIS